MPASVPMRVARVGGSAGPSLGLSDQKKTLMGLFLLLANVGKTAKRDGP